MSTEEGNLQRLLQAPVQHHQHQAADQRSYGVLGRAQLGGGHQHQHQHQAAPASSFHLQAADLRTGA